MYDVKTEIAFSYASIHINAHRMTEGIEEKATAQL